MGDIQTVGDLIAALQNYRPDALVVVDGYEDGLDHVQLRTTFAAPYEIECSVYGVLEEWDNDTRGGKPVLVLSRYKPEELDDVPAARSRLEVTDG